MKKNPLLAKIEAQHKRELHGQRLFMFQQCEDILFIALDEAGYPDPEQFVSLFWDVFVRWADMTDEDYKDDKKLVYTREDVDRRLRAIRGDKYRTREERYYMVREKP